VNYARYWSASAKTPLASAPAPAAGDTGGAGPGGSGRVQYPEALGQAAPGWVQYAVRTDLPDRAALSRPRPGYSSGTRVGVALVRVCFLKNGAPGLTYRQ
jgi:hypothetical protein